MSGHVLRRRSSLLALALAVCLVLTACQTPTLATTTPPPDASSTPTSAPTPTVMTSSNAEPLLTQGLPVLYVRDGDLWCSDLSGTETLQLTQDDALNIMEPAPIEGAVGALNAYYRPNLSPDGRWIAFYHHSNYGFLTIALPLAEDETRQLIDNTCYGVWSPDAARLAYAPNMQMTQNLNRTPVVCVYDVTTRTRKTYYPPEGQDWSDLGSSHSAILWAADGQSITFRCRAEASSAAEDQYETDVVRLDLSSGLSEIVGHVTWVSENQAVFCLDSVGQFTTDAALAATCSTDEESPYTPADGRQVSITTLAGTAGSIITMRDAEGVVLWVNETGITVNKVLWSPNDAWLLLDDDTDMDTPIWRLSADGSGEPEQIVAEGYLYAVVPAWAE